MIFTSYSYVVFLVLAFMLHWVIKPEWRKPLLIISSFVFYCSWKWQYGFLLAGIALFNWAFGRWVVGRDKFKKWLWVGIFINIGILVFFKYTRFFLLNLSALILRLGGAPFKIPEIVLPLGISFFTFQGVAYLVDVCSGERPFRKLIDFLLYKSFWPQLIAGPIIRPGEIRDQIEQRRPWCSDNVEFGLKRILSGFLKKVVIADNIAPIVDLVFLPASQPGPLDVLVGTVAFGLQIYFDFSAYSDIAIGTARLFGFVFPENFYWPYLATNPREFWNHWHMTLSRWIKDYVFTPLAFRFRESKAFLPVAALVAMALCGFWHGAAWTFILWGVWHGVFLILGEMYIKRSNKRLLSRQKQPISMKAGGWLLTMFVVFFGWLIFRAQSLSHLGSLAKALVSGPLLKPLVIRENMAITVALVLLVTALLHIAKALDLGSRWKTPRLWNFVRPVMEPLLYALIVSLVIISDRGSRAFVYFQF